MRNKASRGLSAINTLSNLFYNNLHCTMENRGCRLLIMMYTRRVIVDAVVVVIEVYRREVQSDGHRQGHRDLRGR